MRNSELGYILGFPGDTPANARESREVDLILCQKDMPE